MFNPGNLRQVVHHLAEQFTQNQVVEKASMLKEEKSPSTHIISASLPVMYPDSHCEWRRICTQGPANEEPVCLSKGSSSIGWSITVKKKKKKFCECLWTGFQCGLTMSSHTKVAVLQIQTSSENHPALKKKKKKSVCVFVNWFPECGSPRAHLHLVGMLPTLAPSLPTPSSVLVSISVFIALSTVFHSINSRDNSLLSHPVLPVLILPYWSFQLYISLWKFPSALI